MDQIMQQPDETVDRPMASVPSFIERQLPVSLLSKESYRERMAGPSQTLTPLGSYWKGRKPLVLVRAVLLGLLLPVTDEPSRDRDIFLKLMLMDSDGLRRRKTVPVKAERAAELLPLNVHAEAFEDYNGRLRWRRSLPRVRRDQLELQAFDMMGTDEKLDHCSRSEEMPDSTWDPIWPEVNAYLAQFNIKAESLAALVAQLGRARFGHQPRIGDPFCGGGSIPFEAARIGCDVYASDLNPVACMLTWGALNIVGASSARREQIVRDQRAVAEAVDTAITSMGVEHDGVELDLRLHADAPTNWPHGWRVRRGGDPIRPEKEPYSVTCPLTGWRVPLVGTFQVHQDTRTILRLVPNGVRKAYQLHPEVVTTEDEWKAAELGTVIWDGTDFVLCHNPGTGEVRVRIANRARAYLYCLETRCPRTGWMVPLLPSRVVSFSRAVVARLEPDKIRKRFCIAIDTGVDDVTLEEARDAGTVVARALDFEIDDQRHVTPIATLRGDISIRRNYRTENERAADTGRYAAARNKYSAEAANDLRRWGLNDIVPDPDDIWQERLYCIQWTRPNGETFFSAPNEQDYGREARLVSHVQENLSAWQRAGLVPDMPIEPGMKTEEPIRTRGWTYWHHLFTPRDLLMLSLIAKNSLGDPATTMQFTKILDFSSKLCRWIIRSGSGPGGSDFTSNVFSNQALNTLFTYANRALPQHEFVANLRDGAQSHGTSRIESHSASALRASADIFITDPPYADAVVYHEITEYFIAWLRKSPPPPFDLWKPWDSKRPLAIQGTGEGFRKGMVEAYSEMARRMPDNCLQVVMFTHQDTAVWADLAAILWASGLQVTGGWCVVTETDASGRKGNYVQGTVLLVLRKRTGDASAFLARLQRPVELAVERKLNEMRELNPQDEPDFGDTDFQLGAYAAALKELTAYAQIDGRPVADEVLNPTAQAGTQARVTALLDRARSIASDFLIPDGLPRAVWAELNPAERFYVKGMELEREGETRYAAFQEMARGFGIHGFRELLASTDANAARLKTAGDLRARNLRRAGAADRAEDHELEDFAGGLVRHALYSIHLASQQDDVRAPLPWFVQNLTEYWQRQNALVAVLDFIGSVTTSARAQEAEWATRLAGAVRNHRP